MKFGLRPNILSALVATLTVCCSPSSYGKEKKSVTIDNTAANPVPVNVQNLVSTRSVDNSALQPFAKSASSNGVIQSFAEITFDVPAGKRLVIEFITAEAFLPLGQVASAQIFTTQPDQSVVRHPLEMSQRDLDQTKNYYETSQSLRLYSDPRTPSVTIRILRDSTSGTWNASASISGYLVDLP